MAADLVAATAVIALYLNVFVLIVQRKFGESACAQSAGANAIRNAV